MKIILRGFIFFLLLTILSKQNSYAQLCATPGADGPTNITGSINTYFPAQPNTVLPAGISSIKLAPVPAIDAYGNNFGTVAISAGDLLLIIQMQDASISFTNDTKYGANNATAGTDGLGGTGFTDIGNSGRFEYLVATNNVPLTGGTLTFKGAGTGNGTIYTYTNADANATRGKREFQIIRIPQYSNLQLTSNISPPPFNGNAGGVIAFSVAGTMDFNGFTIDVSGRGFRGGYSLIKVTQGINLNDLYVAASADNRVSGKGEGIAGTPRYMWDGFNQIDNLIEGLPGGSGGRGAPGNAGGGGNDVNAGGGGGGNGGMGGVGGYGYQVDPGTFPNGGRPGFTNFAATPDVNRLIMGGGGGGGHANDALTGVKGGVGGGVVLISAITIKGTGTILANGSDGAPGEFGGHPDGSGGGGAGGTVLVKVSNPDPTAKLAISANGGKGGNTIGDDPVANGVQPHGPGGGGGGGQIFYSIASGTIINNVAGGASGKTNGGAGITHNAANGATGVANPVALGSLPISLQGSTVTCYPELVTTMSVPNPTVALSGGDVVNYTIKITNTASGGSAGGVEANCSFPAVISFVSATATYTGAASGPAQLTNTGMANQVVLGDFNIPFGETVTITLSAKIDCSASGTYNSNAQAVYLDPTRDYQQPNRRITAATNAFPGALTTYETGVTGPVPGSNYDGSVSTAENVIVKNNTTVANNTITAPPAASLCGSGDPGNIVGSIATGGTGTYVYQWQSSADNVNFTNVNGAITRDYDPSLVTATTYYRRTITSSGACSTPSISNVVTVSVLTSLPVPVPTAATVSVCSGSSAGLSVSNPQAGITYNWYNTPTGGTLLAPGNAYTTAPLTSSTTYYVEAMNNIGGCTSATRAAVLVNITQSPVTPTPVSPTVSVCSGSTATLSVSNPQSITYNWYDSATKTNLLFTGPSYTTKPITVSTTFYVEAVNGSCAAPAMASVQVSVIALPAAPVVVKSPVSTCSGTQVTLSIASPQSGLTYNWYNAATGGTSVFTGTDFLTPQLSSSTTYYVEAVNSNSCTSATRAAASVIVTPTPGIITQNTSICPGTSGTIVASSSDPDATISWYTSNASTTPLATGSNFKTPVLNNNAIYYAEAVNNTTGCISVTRSIATVTMYQQLAAPVVAVDGTTVTTVTFSWGAVDGASGYQVSLDGGVTFNTPSSGTSGLTHTVTGLKLGESVTIVVEATGVSTCQLSGSSTAVTGVAHNSVHDLIYVANAFTPNGDGVNDVVYVHSEEIKSLNFYVYDQWGEMLFKSTSQSVGWDGTYKGTKQPVGVYVYYVQAVMNDGQKVTKKGTITLLK